MTKAVRFRGNRRIAVLKKKNTGGTRRTVSKGSRRSPRRRGLKIKGRRTIRQRATEEDESIMIIEGGDKFWLNVDGEIHRIGGPAVERADGTREWYENGERHREGGPAVIYANGDRIWYKRDKIHRDDDEPAIEKADGSKEWWENGKRHREGLPAVENADGRKEWYKEGKLHRIGGPAIISAKGRREWYREGIKISKPLSSQGYEKCHEIFEIGEDKRKYMVKPNPSVGDLLLECKILETDRKVDPNFLKKLVKEIREDFMLSSPIPTITTETGRELRDAIPHRKKLGMYIPQADTSTSLLKVTYKDQPGIDYGGMSRQFIAGLMKTISTTLFDVIEMESEDYLRICERAPHDLKIEPPRYYITKKEDEVLSDELGLETGEKISEVYELAGAMFAYSMLNEIPFDIPLSRVLLNAMLRSSYMDTNTFLPIEKAVTYYILDTGKVLNKEFEFPGMSPEDVEEYSEQKADSLSESARLTYRVNKRLFSFLQGFEHVGDVLRHKISVNELLAMVYKSEITRDEMVDFLSRVVFENLTQTEIDKIKSVILGLPTDGYRQLLAWWSGIPAIIRGRDYTITGRSGDLSYQFNAHTCFFGFDVNKAYIFDPEFENYLQNEIKLERTTTV